MRQLRKHLDGADWVSGQSSAGSLSGEVKSNHQLEEESQVAVSLGNRILKVLGNHPRFICAARHARERCAGVSEQAGKIRKRAGDPCVRNLPAMDVQGLAHTGLVLEEDLEP